MKSSEQEFVNLLRTAVTTYLRAVDEWEATYNRYYRLPGHAHVVSPDMASEQRELEERRRLLQSLLPRTAQLCRKYGLANPFPGLLRSSFGQYAPQQRIESAISRNERNAVTTCLEQLTDACGGGPTAKSRDAAFHMGPSSPPAAGFRRGRMFLTVAVCALAAMLVAARLPFTRGLPSATPNLDQQPYGKRSGDDLRTSWEAERKRESARFSNADLQRMVERLFVEDDPGRANFHGLLYAGARPLPFLLQALDDPRTSTTVFSKTAFDPIAMSPFSRICQLLDNLMPPEAVQSLSQYAGHPDPMFRREAASLLAGIGTAQCLDPVKRALEDQDHQVRVFTLIGLKRGLGLQRRDEIFLSGVFPLLIPMLKAGTYDTVSPASVMMAASPVQAVPILESPAYFSVRNPQLPEVLAALNHEDVKVPREILLPLLAQLEPRAAAPSGEGAYAAALALYANNPDDRAADRFRTLLQSPSDIIASTAARGLETLFGIHAHDAVWDAYNKRGFSAMTRPQQFYFAVELYRDEVDNGGHNQYFYNSDSDLYPVAIEGLRTIGATAKAAILADAGHAFAPGLPAPTETVRRQQMEAFGALQGRIFETADQRFYNSEKEPGNRLDVLLTLYALNHHDDFAGSNSAHAR